MRQKGTPDPGRILKSKKCCDAQQLPNGFRSSGGIGGHSIGWATSAADRLFLTSALGQKRTFRGVRRMSALLPKADTRVFLPLAPTNAPAAAFESARGHSRSAVGWERVD